MAAELFDLLGDAVFEHIGELLERTAGAAAGAARLSRQPSAVRGTLAALIPPLHSPPLNAAGDLLQQRASIAANVRRLVAGFREAEAADKAAAAMPSYGSTVTVMSESQVGGCGWAASSWAAACMRCLGAFLSMPLNFLANHQTHLS